MGFLSPPETPAEDPNAARLRREEEERAKRDRIKSIQEQLSAETQFKSGGLGTNSLLNKGAFGKIIKKTLLGAS